jgi:hypothetical protein
MPFHLLKSYIRNPSLFFISFFNLPPGLATPMPTGSARVYCQVSIFAKLVCQTVGDQFFSFCQNLMDAKLICQTAGDVNSLPNHVVIFDF